MKSKGSFKKTSIALLLLAMVATVAGSASADQVILNPDGLGDISDLDPTPDTSANWETVLTNDGDASFVGTASLNWLTDLYSLEDAAVSGTINWVRVYVIARSRYNYASPPPSLKTVVKTGGTEYAGAATPLTTTYSQYFTEYAQNPGGGDWTWADINALQAGVRLTRTQNGGWVRATQVYVLVDYTPPECEWIGETAWAAGDRYVEQGNWATYTPYVADSTVTLYAGQTMEAGTVHFSEPDGDSDVTITITLNSGWRFEDVAENVKIQDYGVAPSGNPSPGLFDHKGDATGSPFSIVVPGNYFYGVHVDVEWEDCG